MTSLKVYALLVTTTVLGLVAVCTAQPIFENTFLGSKVENVSNHLIVGVRQYGDQAIFHEDIEEKYQWTGQKLIVNRTVTAPYDYVITQVRCLDQATDGTGAEATVTGGGPGSNWVSLRFKSQRWHGIYFNVEVYAKAKN